MNENEIKDLRKDLGGIYDRLTSIETIISERCNTRRDAFSKLEVRVRSLEVKQAMIFGGLILLSALLGYVVKGMGVN